MASSPAMTVDEWAALPEDDPRELVDGELVEPEVGGFAHSHLIFELTLQLAAHFRPRGGFIVGDGLRVALGERRGRIPDAAVFLERPPMTGAVRTLPAIVIEVLSEGATNRRRDRVAKLHEYATHRIPQYWLIDPEARTLEVFALRSDLYALVAAATEGRLAIPDHDGLVVDLDELFARLD